MTEYMTFYGNLNNAILVNEAGEEGEDSEGAHAQLLPLLGSVLVIISTSHTTPPRLEIERNPLRPLLWHPNIQTRFYAMHTYLNARDNLQHDSKKRSTYSHKMKTSVCFDLKYVKDIKKM